MTRAMRTGVITFEGLYPGSAPITTIVEVLLYLKLRRMRLTEITTELQRTLW